MPGGVVAPPELIAAWQTDAFPHGIRADRSLTIVSLVLTPIAFVIVFVRIYDRAFVRHNAGLDDILIVASLFPLAGLGICTILEQLYGFDRHTWDLTVDLIAPSRKLVLSISILSLSSCGLIKISILLFYRRLGDVKPWFRAVINVNIAFIALYTLSFSLTIPFECTPTSAYWNKANPLWTATHQWHCIDEGAKLVAAGALSALQDFIACTLPMALFWDLRISKRSKFALCFVFGLGIFTCAGGIMRTVQLHYVFYETYDVTWGARWAFALTHIEACLGAICASVPALKNSLQRLLRAIADLCSLGSARGGSGSGAGSTQSLRMWHRSAGGRRDDGEGGGGSKAVRRMSKGPFAVFGASEQELVVSQNADVLRSGRSRGTARNDSASSSTDIEMGLWPHTAKDASRSNDQDGKDVIEEAQ